MLRVGVPRVPAGSRVGRERRAGRTPGEQARGRQPGMSPSGGTGPGLGTLVFLSVTDHHFTTKQAKGEGLTSERLSEPC